MLKAEPCYPKGESDGRMEALDRYPDFRSCFYCYFLLGRAAFQNASAETNVVLILDPGHGGKDRGGYDGRGFKLDGARIPEDAYTYDIAKRVERLAVLRGWKVVFTAIDGKNDAVIDNESGEILPPKKTRL